MKSYTHGVVDTFLITVGIVQNNTINFFCHAYVCESVT